MMKLLFLGTGTSTGVPQIGCRCEVCRSSDPHDNRLRCSALLSTPSASILIDCSPDFREQILRAGSPRIDAVILTHSHYDHVGGIDDLRPYTRKDNGLPIYSSADVARDIRERLPYCFTEHPYPGIPDIRMNEIKSETFTINGCRIEPLDIIHHKIIKGYKIGNLAYITDAKSVPQSTLDKIAGIDTLVINALRIMPHNTHMSLEESLSVIRQINPRIAYLIHFSDGIGLHSETSMTLPDNVKMAYDGMTISIPD